MVIIGVTLICHPPFSRRVDDFAPASVAQEPGRAARLPRRHRPARDGPRFSWHPQPRHAVHFHLVPLLLHLVPVGHDQRQLFRLGHDQLLLAAPRVRPLGLIVRGRAPRHGQRHGAADPLGAGGVQAVLGRRSQLVRQGTTSV